MFLFHQVDKNWLKLSDNQKILSKATVLTHAIYVELNNELYNPTEPDGVNTSASALEFKFT